MVFQGCFKKDSRVFHRSFKCVSRKFQGCFQSVLKGFHISFMLHGTHRSFPSRRRACFVRLIDPEIRIIKVSNKKFVPDQISILPIKSPNSQL